MLLCSATLGISACLIDVVDTVGIGKVDTGNVDTVDIGKVDTGIGNVDSVDIGKVDTVGIGVVTQDEENGEDEILVADVLRW